MAILTFTWWLVGCRAFQSFWWEPIIFLAMWALENILYNPVFVFLYLYPQWIRILSLPICRINTQRNPWLILGTLCWVFYFLSHVSVFWHSVPWTQPPEPPRTLEFVDTVRTLGFAHVPLLCTMASYLCLKSKWDNQKPKLGDFPIIKITSPFSVFTGNESLVNYNHE